MMPQIYKLSTVLFITACACLTGCRWTSTGQNTVGVRLFQQGRYPEAMQQFRVALNSDPSNPDAYYNLASTYHKLAVANNDQALIEQSESLYNQCLDISPNHVDCHRGLAVLLAETSRKDSAVRLLKNWASSNPASSDPRVELGRLYQELGEQKLAEQYLDEALAINASDYRAWTAKGRMRQANGELSQALQNFQQSLAINGMQPQLMQEVAALNVRIAQNTLTPGQPAGGWTVQNQPAGSVRRY